MMHLRAFCCDAVNSRKCLRLNTFNNDAVHAIDLAYLYPAHFPRRLHAAGHVDCVAPDVILRLLGTHNTGNDATVVETGTKAEPLEAVAVDSFQDGHQLNGELHQDHAEVMLSHALQYILPKKSEMRKAVVGIATFDMVKTVAGFTLLRRSLSSETIVQELPLLQT